MRWTDRPRDKDFAGAENYLQLRYPPDQAARLIRKLRSGDVEERRVDDVFRACRLDPLDGKDPRVQDVVRKHVLKGKPIPPALVVSTDRGADLANGLHHLSFVYHSDPAAPARVIVAQDF